MPSKSSVPNLLGSSQQLLHTRPGQTDQWVSLAHNMRPCFPILRSSDRLTHMSNHRVNPASRPAAIALAIS